MFGFKRWDPATTQEIPRPVFDRPPVPQPTHLAVHTYLIVFHGNKEATVEATRYEAKDFGGGHVIYTFHLGDQCHPFPVYSAPVASVRSIEMTGSRIESVEWIQTRWLES